MSGSKNNSEEIGKMGKMRIIQIGTRGREENEGLSRGFI